MSLVCVFFVGHIGTMSACNVCILGHIGLLCDVKDRALCLRRHQERLRTRIDDVGWADLAVRDWLAAACMNIECVHDAGCG